MLGHHFSFLARSQRSRICSNPWAISGLDLRGGGGPSLFQPSTDWLDVSVTARGGRYKSVTRVF
ncbi:hypothetical protein thalar_01302 [Litoreibacter arenae DSM 19593]|uniref:Uncharacterized protein n=1 Tax=Litoreibacter arenae DSM 19593 TaxID=1123360 RepID=S9QEW4_9RHOB|nr:hypothetical protein thalar_01302 [Litoreibacter arenae DSM 19593]